MSTVVLGMATIRSREDSLKLALSSLVDQCDTIYLYLNDYEYIPTWLGYHIFSNVKPVLGCNSKGDLGDASKFYGAELHTEGHFISVDDDIVYAKDFVETMVSTSCKYNGEVLCTTHGRRLGDEQVPIQGYFQNPHPNTQLFHGFSSVSRPEFVHFGGTGSMCFDLSKKRPPSSIFEQEQNNADIWIGIYAQETQTPILVVPHSESWLKQTGFISLEDTIWWRAHKIDTPKTLINTHLKHIKLHTV